MSSIFKFAAVVFVVMITVLMLIGLAKGSLHTKVIDLNIIEHRYAIVKAHFPDIILYPIPKDEIGIAEITCIQLAIRNGFSEPMTPSATDNQGSYLCTQAPSVFDKNVHQGWKNICKDFDMVYINKPSKSSVLCANKSKIV